MACKYKKCARWCKTRLSDHSTYGTWSLRKYWHIYGELSRYHNFGKRESIYHHEAILWMWLCRAPACSQRKRHTGTWKTYTYICCSTYGSLARSHYDLRFLCKSILQRRCIWKIRCIGCWGRLGLRSKTLLFRNCWKIRRSGTGSS